MRNIELFGIIMPAILIFLSMWGIFSKKFTDNLIQRIALCGLIVVSVIRMARAGEIGAVDLTDIALYLVLITYAAGVISKVYVFGARPHNQRQGDMAGQTK